MARAVAEVLLAPNLPSARMMQQRPMTSMMDWRMMTSRLLLALILVPRQRLHEPDQSYPLQFSLCSVPTPVRLAQFV